MSKVLSDQIRIRTSDQAENRSYAATLVMIVVGGLLGAAQRRNSSAQRAQIGLVASSGLLLLPIVSQYGGCKTAL